MPWGIGSDFSFDRSFSSNTSISNTNSSFSEADRSFSSVGIGERPEPIELPLKSTPVPEQKHIFAQYFDYDENHEIEFKSEMDILSEYVLEDCDFLEEQLLSDGTRSQADLLQETLSNISISNNSTRSASTNAFFENIPSPQTEFDLPIPEKRQPSSDDSFSTAYSQ